MYKILNKKSQELILKEITESLSDLSVTHRNLLVNRTKSFFILYTRNCKIQRHIGKRLYNNLHHLVWNTVKKWSSREHVMKKYRDSFNWTTENFIPDIWDYKTNLRIRDYQKELRKIKRDKKCTNNIMK